MNMWSSADMPGINKVQMISGSADDQWVEAVSGRLSVSTWDDDFTERTSTQNRQLTNPEAESSIILKVIAWSMFCWCKDIAQTTSTHDVYMFVVLSSLNVWRIQLNCDCPVIFPLSLVELL